MTLTYITETDMADNSRTFYNTRTKEVVPAGRDDVAGKVWTDRDGTVKGAAFHDPEGAQTYGSIAEAVNGVAQRG